MIYARRITIFDSKVRSRYPTKTCFNQKLKFEPKKPPLMQLEHASSAIVQKRSATVSTIHHSQMGILTGFLVCMKTVPGPVNLHTRPSPEDKPEIIPPEATRSSIYLVFHATKWPLSTIYLSPSASFRLLVLQLQFQNVGNLHLSE